MGGAEFYPSCTQVLIGGSGNTQPDITVSFPGAYHDDDPGIYDPDVSEIRLLKFNILTHRILNVGL